MPDENRLLIWLAMKMPTIMRLLAALLVMLAAQSGHAQFTILAPPGNTAPGTAQPENPQSNGAAQNKPAPNLIQLPGQPGAAPPEENAAPPAAATAPEPGKSILAPPTTTPAGPPANPPPANTPPASTPPGAAAPATPAAQPGGATPAAPIDPTATPLPPQTAVPTKETIEKAIQALKDDTQLEDEERKKLLDVWQGALEHLDALAGFQASLTEYETRTQSAPRAAEDVRKQLDAAVATRRPVVPEATLSELEQLLSEQEALQPTKERELTDVDAALKLRQDRQVAIPKRIAEVSQRLAEIEKRLAEPVGETPLAIALRKKVLVEKAALQAESLMLPKERQFYEATSEMKQLLRRLLARETQLLEQEVKALRDAVSEKRLSEAKDESQEATKLAEDQQLAALKPFAEQNAELAAMRAELADQLQQVTDQIAAADQMLKRIRTNFSRDEERLSRGGSDSAIGFLLQTHRSELRHPQYYHNRVRDRQQLINDAQVALYNVEESEDASQAFEQGVRKVVNQALNEEANHAALLRSAGDKLIASRSTYLEQLRSDYERYFRRLIEMDAKDQELIEETIAFETFIREHVLWAPNRQPLSLEDFNIARHAITQRLTTERMMKEFASLKRLFRSQWGWFIVALLLVVAIFVFERKIKQHLIQINREDDETHSYTPTMKCALYTVIGASLWPLVFLVLGGVFSAKSASGLWLAVGSSLQTTAACLFALQLMRRVCRREGLAIAHFGWDPASVLRFRHRMRWVVWIGVPLAFLILTLRNDSASLDKATLARMVFLVAVVALLVKLPFLSSPFSTLLREALGQTPNHWFARMYNVWLSIAGVLIAALAVLTIIGYSYTAAELSGRLFWAFSLMCGVICAHALVVRWLVLSRRRLAMVEAKERELEAAAAAENVPSEFAESALSIPEEVNPADIDSDAIDAEVRGMVRNVTVMAVIALMWMLWNDVLPALRFVEEYPLWQDAEGNAITLGNAAMAILTIAVSVMVTKTAPSLLESAVLGRMPLDSGARFAITTISRYIMAILGIVVACKQIGFSWFNVQWFVAAVTVGLGFGLQEIFANFVSGLILLLERPIRVGDIVSVGDTTGVVARIRMRATTIRDFDRKELIVPNREFITGRLLNWTLSDNINRIVIEVGVSYQSDIEHARLVLLRVVRRHPEILKDPAPTVVFDGFLDSSLRLVARVFLSDLDNRLTVTHELHSQILRAFRDAKIDIPFPQRDLHIRSTIERNGQPVELASNSS